MAEGPVTFRDHFLSIYQSAAAEVARQVNRRNDGPPGAPASVETGDVIVASAAAAAGRFFAARQGIADEPPGGAPIPVSSCAELGLKFLEANLRNDQAAITKLTGEFKAGSCDPAWITTLTEYARYFGAGGERAEIPYIPPAQAGERVIEIKAGAKVALVADWGTGAGPAREILRQIASLSPDVFIHLGDIYYSGTPKECDANFKRLLEAALGTDRTALPIFTLSGNHDMYCGGVGYYATIAGLNPEPMRQPASYFCLRSSDGAWQLLAMDTGLHDYSPLSVGSAVTWIDPEEVRWLRRRVDEFEGRTILLSHHQLFSAFSPIGPAEKSGRRSAANPNLSLVLEQLDTDRKIAAWFWGHEHSLCIYDPFNGLQRGRCIGHGAVPVFGDEDIYAVIDGLQDVPRLIEGTKLRVGGDVWPHGFAFLTLGMNGQPVIADYYQDFDGRPSRVFTEAIA